VDGLKSAKEVWDTLFINHDGTKQVREGRIRALKSELNCFVIKEDESPQDMYNLLNKIINKIKSLGSTRWGRREVVDKILSVYMARDVQLPLLIREKRGFKKFTPVDVIGRTEEHLITIKESKISQEMSKMHEQLEKNKGVALKASNKEKKSSSSTSKTVVKEDSDEDSDENMTPEQMTLFIRKFNKVIKKSGFFNKNKDKDKSKTNRTSKRPCFGCGKEGHFIAECPNIKVRRRDTVRW
jgi:bifunctional DNA-binding transcriptional regulator/antitoxin component of YhaV-PrlF toxin-antitoxin module